MQDTPERRRRFHAGAMEQARESDKTVRPIFIALAIALEAMACARLAAAQSVPIYHGTADRRGSFIVPGLTAERARAIHPEAGFAAKFSGHLYGQPLFWRDDRAGTGMLVVATESNQVEAMDATTGRSLWSRTLGAPVARSALRCGNISPLGVTGTPVIDPGTQTLYVDAAVDGQAGMRHLVFALSLKDGAPLSGWPVDVAALLKAHGEAFNARDQNQRGALTVLDGRLYVPFGGHYGDCGNYQGWVVGIALDDPRNVVTWSTAARGGGIWAPGGMATDGASLFVATGNTFGARAWSGGEAIVRLTPDLKASGHPRDFFAPGNWRALDARDLDLGGTNPVLVDAGNSARVLALGKDGRAYLLDRDNLGGIAGSLVDETVSPRAIRTAPATYQIGDAAYVAFEGTGSRCPAGRPSGDLTVLKVTSGNSPALTTAWCGDVRGAGSPIVTTTDGHADPVVWMVGAEGDNRLHAFKGDTGEPLLGAGVGTMSGLHHFQTLIAADGRLYVGADDRIYAFGF